MIVRNNKKRVIVLKSFEAAPLRLLPGMNEVEGDLKVYTKGNPAAAATVKECLSIVEADGLTAEERAEAKDAKSKNDKLNASAKVLKVAQENLAQAEKKLANSDATLKEMADKIANLEEKAKDDGIKDAKIKELEEKLAALTSKEGKKADK